VSYSTFSFLRVQHSSTIAVYKRMRTYFRVVIFNQKHFRIEIFRIINLKSGSFVAGQCSTYSFGNEPYGFINFSFTVGYTLMLLWLAFILNMILRFPPNIHMAIYPNYVYTLICFAGLCMSFKISNALTCRSFKTLLDIRFISILMAQLIGFIRCLSFVYKLGCIFAINRPMKRSENWTSYIVFPLSNL
jgi:hypothetical protein